MIWDIEVFLADTAWNTLFICVLALCFVYLRMCVLCVCAAGARLILLLYYAFFGDVMRWILHRRLLHIFYVAVMALQWVSYRRRFRRERWMKTRSWSWTSARTDSIVYAWVCVCVCARMHFWICIVYVRPYLCGQYVHLPAHPHRSCLPKHIIYSLHQISVRGKEGETPSRDLIPNFLDHRICRRVGLFLNCFGIYHMCVEMCVFIFILFNARFARNH